MTLWQAGLAVYASVGVLILTTFAFCAVAAPEVLEALNEDNVALTASIIAVTWPALALLVLIAWGVEAVLDRVDPYGGPDVRE